MNFFGGEEWYYITQDMTKPTSYTWILSEVSLSPVAGHKIDVASEGNLTSGAPSTALGGQERKSMEVHENPHGVKERKGISSSATQGVEVCLGKLQFFAFCFYI